MKVAETLGFMAVASEGFSEPPGLRMSVRAVGGMVDREILRRRGGYGGGAPAIAPRPWSMVLSGGLFIIFLKFLRGC